MFFFTLLRANLRRYALHYSLFLLLFALGAGLLSLLLQVSQQLGEQRKRNLAGIDLVVGAKGSPLQIILCNIFQADAPTGNVLYKDAYRLSRHPMVKKAYMLSVGDSYQGARIVGCTPSYGELYQAKLAEGKWTGLGNEVVLGANVAKRSGLGLGAKFVGDHGLADSAAHHETHPYEVAGILAPSGSVMDNLILSSLESYWTVHDIALDDSLRQVTALLLQFKGAMGKLQVPRLVQEQTPYQAAVPIQELMRLEALLGNGLGLLKGLAYLIVLVAGFAMFALLYQGMRARKQEWAMMRLQGYSFRKIATLILSETLIPVILGEGLGILAAHGALSYFMKNLLGMEGVQPVFMREELHLFCLLLLLGIFAVSIPLLRVYRQDISLSLQEGK